MNDKKLFHAGLFCVKEAVYNVLLEASHTQNPELDHRQISERLEIEHSYLDSAEYPLLRGILDVLRREERVERVGSSRKMIWKVL